MDTDTRLAKLERSQEYVDKSSDRLIRKQDEILTELSKLSEKVSIYQNSEKSFRSRLDVAESNFQEHKIVYKREQEDYGARLVKVEKDLIRYTSAIAGIGSAAGVGVIELFKMLFQS